MSTSEFWLLYSLVTLRILFLSRYFRCTRLRREERSTVKQLLVDDFFTPEELIGIRVEIKNRDVDLAELNSEVNLHGFSLVSFVIWKEIVIYNILCVSLCFALRGLFYICDHSPLFLKVCPSIKSFFCHRGSLLKKTLLVCTVLPLGHIS